MTIALTDLSLEIIEHILFLLDPLDIAPVSQTSRFFYDVVYGHLSKSFWRGLYLAQPLDDPRRTVTRLGNYRDDVDWKGELQRITRARTVMTNPDVRRRGEMALVLQTCIDLVTQVLPITSPDGIGPMSRNVRWMQHFLSNGACIDAWSEEVGDGEEEGEEGEGEGERGLLSKEEEQLLARLHALYGLTARDLDPERRREAQAFVYSLRNVTPERNYGPFLPDGSRRVDWTFMWLLVHDLGILLLETDEDDERTYFGPLGAVNCQSIIPRGLKLDNEDDWAGIEGLWTVRYGFMDHREFILYNDPSVPHHEPQDATIFDGTEEKLASLDIFIRVTSVEPDPCHPNRPRINVAGEVDGTFTIVGFVKLTDDEQIWWHYQAGNDNQMVWSCDAIGMGGIRSRYGFVGVWSTVFHDAEDPIGPFWLQRELVLDE